MASLGLHTAVDYLSMIFEYLGQMKDQIIFMPTNIIPSSFTLEHL